MVVEGLMTALQPPGARRRPGSGGLAGAAAEPEEQPVSGQLFAALAERFETFPLSGSGKRARGLPAPRALRQPQLSSVGSGFVGSYWPASCVSDGPAKSGSVNEGAIRFRFDASQAMFE